jgi:hypothetical protein
MDELGQDRAQVALAEGYQVVEALAADGPHPALRGARIGVRTLSMPSPKVRPPTSAPPDPVAVMDLVVRFAVPGRCFDQLPPDPRRGGMGRQLEVDKLATAVADEEERIEGLEAQGLDDK